MPAKRREKRLADSKDRCETFSRPPSERGRHWLRPARERSHGSFYRFHILKRALQSSASANDLFEVVFRADLFLEIKFLFLQLVLQRIDLAISQRVLNRNGDLLSYLGQQRCIVFSEGVLVKPPNTENTEHAIMRD